MSWYRCDVSNKCLNILKNERTKIYKVTVEELERRYEQIRSVRAVYDLNPNENPSIRER